MIANIEQYEKAQAELRDLEERLLLNYSTTTSMILLGPKGLRILLGLAGIRKMIARLHEELALYEGGQEIGHIKHP